MNIKALIICRLFLLCFFQIFLSSGKHQFDSVQLVNFAGAWIIVDGYNVCCRIFAADFFYNTLTYDMVRQTSERLDTNNIRNISMDL